MSTYIFKLTMENLVSFNTGRSCGFEGFPPSSDDQGCSNRLEDKKNGHIVEKKRTLWLWNSTTDTLEGGLGSYRALSASCLVVVLAASMVWLLVIPLIRQKRKRLTTFVSQIDRQRNSRCRLGARKQRSGHRAYFWNDTQIVRWDVATVVAEIETLCKSEDLWQARAQMKAERKSRTQRLNLNSRQMSKAKI